MERLLVNDCTYLCADRGIVCMIQDDPHWDHVVDTLLSTNKTIELLSEYFGETQYDNIINLSVIDGWNETAQRIFDLFGQTKESLEHWMEISYNLLLNPLPILRDRLAKAGHTIKIGYRSTSSPDWPVESNISQEYLLVTHDTLGEGNCHLSFEWGVAEDYPQDDRDDRIVEIIEEPVITEELEA